MSTNRQSQPRAWRRARQSDKRHLSAFVQRVIFSKKGLGHKLVSIGPMSETEEHYRKVRVRRPQGDIIEIEHLWREEV